MSITTISAAVTDKDGKEVRPAVFEKDVVRKERFTLKQIEQRIAQTEADLAKLQAIKAEIEVK